MTFTINAANSLFSSSHTLEKKTFNFPLSHLLETIDKQLNQNPDLSETEQENFLLALKGLSVAKNEEIDLTLNNANLPNLSSTPKNELSVFPLEEIEMDEWNTVANNLIRCSHKLTILIGHMLLVVIRQENTRNEMFCLGENLLKDDANATKKEESENLNRIDALEHLRQLIFFPEKDPNSTADHCLTSIYQSYDGTFRHCLINILIEMGYKNQIFNHYAKASSQADATIESDIESILLHDAKENSYKRKPTKHIDSISYSRAAKKHLKDINEDLTANQLIICKEMVCLALEHGDSQTIMNVLHTPATKHIVCDLFHKNATPNSFFIAMAGILTNDPEGDCYQSLKQTLFNKLLEKAFQLGECLTTALRLLQSFAIQEPTQWKKLLETSEKTKWEKAKRELSDAFMSSPPHLPQGDLFACWEAIRYHGSEKGDLTKKALQEINKGEPQAYQKTLIILFQLLEQHQKENNSNKKRKIKAQANEFQQLFTLTIEKMVLSDTNIHLALRLINHRALKFHFTPNQISTFATTLINNQQKQKSEDIFHNPQTSWDFLASTLEDCINKKIDLTKLYPLVASINDRPIETKQEQVALINIWSILWKALNKSLLYPYEELLFTIIDGLIHKCYNTPTWPNNIYNFILDSSTGMIAKNLINKENFTDHFINISMLTITMLNRNDNYKLYHTFIEQAVKFNLLLESDPVFFCYLIFVNQKKEFTLSKPLLKESKQILGALKKNFKKKSIVNQDLITNFQKKIYASREFLKKMRSQFFYSLLVPEITLAIASSISVNDACVKEITFLFSSLTKKVRNIWWVDSSIFSSYLKIISYYTLATNIKENSNQKNVIQLQATGIENINIFLLSFFHEWEEMKIDIDADDIVATSLSNFNTQRKTTINQLLKATQEWFLLPNSAEESLRPHLIALTFTWFMPECFIALINENPENKSKIYLPQQIEPYDFYHAQISTVNFLITLAPLDLDLIEYETIAKLLTVITYNVTFFYKNYNFEDSAGILLLCYALSSFSAQCYNNSVPPEVLAIYTTELNPYLLSFCEENPELKTELFETLQKINSSINDLLQNE